MESICLEQQQRPWYQWYRVCLNTIVRRGIELDSERLRILPMGSKVRVVDQQDRRVKIDQPLHGWCSITSSNGDSILAPMDPDPTLCDVPKTEDNEMESSDNESLDLIHEKATLGWHRVCLNTIVRSTANLMSERLRILPMGSRVHIIHSQGRRCKIDNPIVGWVSVESSTADTILSPIEPDRVYDRTHFSPNIAKQFAIIFGKYVCDELGWLQGDEIFVMIVSYLMDPDKQDTDKHVVKLVEGNKGKIQIEEKRMPDISKRKLEEKQKQRSRSRSSSPGLARPGINSNELQENSKVESIFSIFMDPT